MSFSTTWVFHNIIGCWGKKDASIILFSLYVIFHYILMKNDECIVS